MTPLRERLRENLRLTILRFLVEANGYSLNSSTLTSVLDDTGMRETRASVEAELDFLAGAGLVSLDRPIDTITVATLTVPGLEVATGVGRAEGVARPAPGR